MLTEAQRHELVALLAAGHSRRAAARLVGCARSTIYRVEARDPKFAERVARAEGPGESPQKKQDPRKIFPTLHQPSNWRAAAWVLERLNPEDFGPPRNASNFDLLVEADIFRSFVELVRDEIPRDTCCLLVRQINQLLAQYDAPSIPQLDEPDPDPVRADQDNEGEGGRGQVPAEIARLVAQFDGKPFLVDTPEFLADRSASFSQLDVAPINWPELIESTTEYAAETYAAVFASPQRTAQTGRVGRAAPKNKRKRRRNVFPDAHLNTVDDPASPTSLNAEPIWDDLIPSTTTSPAEIFAAVFASARPTTERTGQTGRVGRAVPKNKRKRRRNDPFDAQLNTTDDQASPTSLDAEPSPWDDLIPSITTSPAEIFAAVFASARPATARTDQTGRVGRADQTNNVGPHRDVPPDAQPTTTDDQASPTSRTQDPAGLARILAALNPKPRQTALADSPLFPVVRSTRPTSRCPAKEPALRHPSSEPPTYVASSRRKALLLIKLAIFEKLNFFGPTRSRRARQTKGTAHGGKSAVAAALHSRVRSPPKATKWHSEHPLSHEREKKGLSKSSLQKRTLR
jgi:hypothetical protein